MNKHPFRTIVFLWLAWVLIVIGYQAWASARLQPKFPDLSQEWTTTYTDDGYQVNRPLLLDPFLNDQVCWDSEYYIGIAIGGYDDPRIPHLTPFGTTTYSMDHMLVGGQQYSGEAISLAYAFFPFYPWMIWLVSWPLKLLGLGEIATAALAGVIVSALGTLGGMFALYDLCREKLEHAGAMRAVFYLLIFPTGFFLVQVYTEGLFVGLAFGCLALLRRGKWLPAALLGAAATLTRAVGVALVIPMAITWFRTGEWLDIDLEWRQIYYLWKHAFLGLSLAFRKACRALFRLPSAAGEPTWEELRREMTPIRTVLASFGKMLLAFGPLIAFLIWKTSRLGISFDFVEMAYFGRGVLDFGGAFYNWSLAFEYLSSPIPARAAYFLTEIIGLIVGLVTILAALKRYPEIAWFSLAVFVISWGSGPVQGIQRYILGAPAVFFTLARWGRHPVFDKAWTIFSALWMGFMAYLFAVDFWVA